MFIVRRAFNVRNRPTNVQHSVGCTAIRTAVITAEFYCIRNSLERIPCGCRTLANFQHAAGLAISWFMHTTPISTIHLLIYLYFHLPLISSWKSRRKRGAKRKGWWEWDGIEMKWNSNSEPGYSTNVNVNWNSLENHWQTKPYLLRWTHNFRMPFNSIKFIDMF